VRAAPKLPEIDKTETLTHPKRKQSPFHKLIPLIAIHPLKFVVDGWKKLI
jgi:hypothetical protein